MPRSTSATSARRRAARALWLGAAASAVALGPEAKPAAAQGAPDALAAGREKYVQCASCHGADGRSTVVPQYPKIGGQTAEYVVNALKAYRDGRRLGTYAAMMAAVAKQLSDADIANLAAYVESLDATH
jgi:cytochrome c553